MFEFGDIYHLLDTPAARQEGTLHYLRRKELERLLTQVDDARQDLISGSAFNRLLADREFRALNQALAEGVKPSAYADQAWQWVRELGFVPAEFWPELLDAMDRLLEQPYDGGWAWRSYRSSDYAAYASRIIDMLRSFARDVLLPFKLADLLTGHVPETVTEYMNKCDWDRTTKALVARIASALDRGDPAVEAAIRDMIDGDGTPLFMREVIRGILWCHRGDMHELLGRLLVAARLQEGLRQTICENADSGSPEAFRAMVDVIEQHSLIRFSSVKRAVGTWLGLITEESASLERISGKSVALIARCLRDDAFIEECLAGEDSMQIHIGLWAIGVRDVHAAARRAEQLALHGTHHQRLTAGYFAQTLQLPEQEAPLALRVITAYPEELDTVALYLPMLMPNALPQLSGQVRRDGDVSWRKFVRAPFASEQEARAFHALLVSIRSRVGKKQVFEPCVFPWHKAVLDKADLADRICVLARLLDDDALIDDSIQYFPDCTSMNRSLLLPCSYGRMRTPAQRQMVLTAVCDKSDSSRRAAIKLVDAMTLTPADYAELEKLLRFKYADSRTALIRWMMKQPDDALYATVARLLGDKKSEERRMAALDIIKQLAEEDNRKALIARCAPLVTAYENPTAKEKTLVDSLLEKVAASAAEEEPLYTDADVYHPVIPGTPELEQAVRTYMRYFPEAQLADPSGLPGETGSGTAAQARADFDSLMTCLEQHKMDPVKNTMGEDDLLCNLRGLYRGRARAVLHEVWDAWYQAQVNDPERLLRLCILAHANSSSPAKAIVSAFGEGYQQLSQPQGILSLQEGLRWVHMRHITADLVRQHVPAEDLKQIAAALLVWLAQGVEDSFLWVCPMDYPRPWQNIKPVVNQDQLLLLLDYLDYGHGGLLPVIFPAAMLLAERLERTWHEQSKDPQQPAGVLMYDRGGFTPVRSFQSAMHNVMSRQVFPSLPVVLRASHRGMISPRGVYAWMLTSKLARNGVGDLTLLSGAYRAAGQQYSTRTMYGWHRSARYMEECLQAYLGKSKPETDEDFAMLRYADEVSTPLVRRIIDAELKRGDTETPWSPRVAGIHRIWGAADFMAILSALGKDKLLRSYSFGSLGCGRTESLCTMLGICVPARTDTAEELRRLMKQHKISEKRLIEAALYSPEWIELVGEAIGMPGFRSAAYYFIAHMNEDFDDVRKARIARFTPLSIEELQNGAFDIGWFRSAYEDVGEKCFDMIYDAAKYITSGAKHARARKYADAVLGRLALAATQEEIIQKRNKDLLMAWALIPLSGEDDLQARYLYIQQFLKESRGFGVDCSQDNGQ